MILEVRRYVLASLLAAAFGSLLPIHAGGRSEYAASIEDWRRDRAQRLTSDQGWLTVAGLYWLNEGDNPAGTENGSAVLLPPGTAPPRVGNFRLTKGAVTFTADPAASVTSGGQPVTTIEMKDDTTETPDKIAV